MRIRFERWGVERVVGPVAQVAVGEQVQAQLGCKVAQRPIGFGKVMEPLEEKQGYQGCPNLNAQGVLAGADEAFDLEVLLNPTTLLCMVAFFDFGEEDTHSVEFSQPSFPV